MSCISLRKDQGESLDEAQPALPVRWTSLVRGIRMHAVQQPPEIALDLLQWAEFVEGLAQLHPDDDRP